jgi:hypothetical protein
MPEMGVPSLLQEIRSLRSVVLISTSKMFLFATALVLLFGYPLAASCFSACGVLLFLIQKKPIMTLLQDMKKWFLVACVSFLASLGSCFLIKLAFKYDTKPFYQILRICGFASHEISGGLMVYFLYYDSQMEPENNQSTVQFLEVKILLLEGRSLVAKDKNIFGRHTTSDPYVKIYHANNYVGETAIVWKTLNPVWSNAVFSLPVVPKALTEFNTVELHIYDRDKFTSDDAMGTVFVPIPRNMNMQVCTWYPVKPGSGQDYCRNATGELKIEIELLPLLSKRFKQQLSRISSIRTSGTSAISANKSSRPLLKRFNRSKNDNSKSSSSSIWKRSNRSNRSTGSDSSSKKRL